MTNSQKWVTVVLAAFIFLFILSDILKEDTIIRHDEMPGYDTQEYNEERVQDPPGLTLIKQNGCLACHGQDLRGNPNLGPSLYNAKKTLES